MSPDSRKWKNVITPFQSLKEQQSQNIKKTSGNSDNSKSVTFRHSFEQLQTNMNCGLLNKRNTCYINASLQSFNPLIKLWSNFSLHSDTYWPFVSSLLDQLNFCIDYRLLLVSLENMILICSNSRMQVRLSHVYWKNCVRSHLMPRLCEEQHWKIRCHVTIPKESCWMKSQPQYSICQWQKSFCNFCQSYQPVSIDHQITKVGNYLILQLKRFLNRNVDFIKDITKVNYTKILSVLLVVNEGVSTNSLAL